MDRTDLQQLSKDELIEMVLRLQRSAKDSRTSSKPPSTDQIEKRVNLRPRGAKRGHEPHNRVLADVADVSRDHEPTACKRCGHSFSGNDTMVLIGAYDEIDIPAIRPHVTRRRRCSCHCPQCGTTTKAVAPAVATATPFGPGIHAQAIHLKSFHAISYERLSGAFKDIF